MARSSKIAKWLPGAKTGSPRALGEVLQACRQYLLWVARDQIDPGMQAKGGASDLVQDTFLEAQRDFGRFQGDSEAELLAWLRRLLLNNLANFARSYRDTAKRCLAMERSLELEHGDDSSIDPKGRTATPSTIIMKGEQEKIVEQAMARLPEDYHRVISLWQEENRTFEQIGNLMDRSANAARMLWVRAIERLQEELEAP